MECENMGAEQRVSASVAVQIELLQKSPFSQSDVCWQDCPLFFSATLHAIKSGSPKGHPSSFSEVKTTTSWTSMLAFGAMFCISNACVGSGRGPLRMVNITPGEAARAIIGVRSRFRSVP